MDTVKRIGVLLLIGAVVGNALATFIAPGVLTWYNTGSDANAMCNCVRVAHDTADQLIRAQLIGTGIGAVLFLILGIIISRARSSRAPAAAKTPPPSPLP